MHKFCRPPVKRADSVALYVFLLSNFRRGPQAKHIYIWNERLGHRRFAIQNSRRMHCEYTMHKTLSQLLVCFIVVVLAAFRRFAVGACPGSQFKRNIFKLNGCAGPLAVGGRPFLETLLTSSFGGSRDASRWTWFDVVGLLRSALFSTPVTDSYGEGNATRRCFLVGLVLLVGVARTWHLHPDAMQVVLPSPSQA